MNTLLSLDLQKVKSFKIYPRVAYGPFGTPVIFHTTDRIIADFFQAITDHQSYPTSRDTSEEDHCWFLEIANKDAIMQISFFIPSEKENIVVGGIGEFSKTGHHYDAVFQSRQLYRWYQKYSHRWLEPEDAQ